MKQILANLTLDLYKSLIEYDIYAVAEKTILAKHREMEQWCIIEMSRGSYDIQEMSKKMAVASYEFAVNEALEGE